MGALLGLKQTPEHIERRRLANLGKHTGNQYTRGAVFNPETMVKAVATRTARGFIPFDIGATTRGKPAYNVSPINTQRLVKDGRWQIKCEDNKWRYLSRVMWEQNTGDTLVTADIIHHVNGNPADDRMDNFEKLTTATHRLAHVAMHQHT